VPGVRPGLVLLADVGDRTSSLPDGRYGVGPRARAGLGLDATVLSGDLAGDDGPRVIQATTAQASACRGEAGLYDQAIARRVDTTGDRFTMEIDGTRHTNGSTPARCSSLAPVTPYTTLHPTGANTRPGPLSSAASTGGHRCPEELPLPGA
jgi:hypothetical protein